MTRRSLVVLATTLLAGCRSGKLIPRLVRPEEVRELPGPATATDGGVDTGVASYVGDDALVDVDVQLTFAAKEGFDLATMAMFARGYRFSVSTAGDKLTLMVHGEHFDERVLSTNVVACKVVGGVRAQRSV